MKYPEIPKQFNELFEVLKLKGCPTILATSFIQNNFEYLKKNDVLNHLYFICNHQEIYAILVTLEDSYYWSICYNDSFYPLEKKTEQNNDYIIVMMLNFAETDKVRKIVPNISEMNIETKVKILRSVPFNSTGYHFK